MRAERQLLRLGEYLVGRACQELPPATDREIPLEAARSGTRRHVWRFSKPIRLRSGTGT